ncbi:MAG: hypothetical protein KA974_04940 [Saprospiraceae bacterium]|nr:hypothetical protein [Saprospiraceae bacterium]MBP7699133.1 hypothetical protein [Saprospiraceae bacterium]
MKKTLTGALYCIMGLILTQCAKDNPPPISQIIPEQEISLVSGLQLRDENGSPLGTLGNPNVLMNDTAIAIYPNPARGVMFVHATDTIQQIWMIKGTADTSFRASNFALLLNQDLYSVDKIDNAAVIPIYGINHPNVSINLDNVEIDLTGYYRIFIQLKDGTIHWDNFYKHNSNSTQDAINQLADYWN